MKENGPKERLSGTRVRARALLGVLIFAVVTGLGTTAHADSPKPGGRKTFNCFKRSTRHARL